MKNTKHMDQIDGLRGIAMLLVVCSHYFARFTKDYFPNQFNDFLGILYWGEIGVTVFFIISGFFMIPVGRNTAYDYIKKRIAKIWPPYVIAITVCFIATQLFYLPNRTVGLFDYFLNIPFINGFIGRPYVDAAHWYLTTIISSTIIFAFLKGLSTIQRNICYWIWCTLIVVLFYFDSSNTVVHLLRSGLYTFLGKDYAATIILGAVIADFWNGRKDDASYITIIICLATKVLTATTSKAIELPIVSVIFVVVLFDKIRILNMKTLRYLGMISLYVYLIHQNLGYLIMLKIIGVTKEYCTLISFLMIFISIGMGCMLKSAVAQFDRLNTRRKDIEYN